MTANPAPPPPGPAPSPSPSHLANFLVGAAANVAGTLASGVLLGTIAVRVGLLTVNQDALDVTSTYALVLGVILASLIVIAVLAVLIISLILPAQGRRLERSLYTGLQVAGGGAIFLTLLFWCSVLAVRWDPEGLIVAVVTTAIWVACILVVRAIAERRAP